MMIFLYFICAVIAFADTVLLRVDPPPPGSVCCWCICPPGVPGVHCDGCRGPDTVLFSVYGAQEAHLPLCPDHYPVAVDAAARLMQPEQAHGPEEAA